MKKFIKIFFIIFLSTKSIFTINVTIGNQLSKNEIDYLNKRKKTTKTAIKKIINNQNSELKLPRISVCMSGGGYRAMISSLGFINGLTKTKLIDTINYASTLSGSTWLLVPMLIRKINGKNYKTLLEKEVNLSFFNFNTINFGVIKKHLPKNPELIDIWGGVLAERLLKDIGDYGQNITFKSIRKNLNKSEQDPFPIFSCVIANSEDEKLPYEWLEVNPFQTYAECLGGSIPTKYFGSTFQNGASTKKSPENSAGFFMGMFGSPFCMSGGDIFNFALMELEEYLHFKSYRFLEWFEKEFKKLGLYKDRFCPAEIQNFSFGMEKSHLKNQKHLKLIDAGFYFNVPFPPILRRKSDIIIVCDASSDACIPNHPELHLAYIYAKEHGIPFPNIEKPYVVEDNLYIFYDKNNPKAPTIIYFTNPVSDSTLKMDYQPQEFSKLYKSMKHLVENNYQKIINIIKLKFKDIN